MAPNQGSTFQGFKGNMFNVPPTINQSGQATASNAFGAGFGSQQNQQSMFSFNASSAAPNNTFAASTPAGGNMFGKSVGPSMFSTSQPFTNASETTQAEDKSNGDQMQMSPDGKPLVDSKSMFNVSAPPPPSFTSSTTTAPKFNFTGAFSQPSAPTVSSSATTSAPAPMFNFSASTPASAPLFGGLTKASEGSKPNFGTSLFGRENKAEGLAKTDTATSAAPAASPSLFSAPSFGSGPTTSTLFGNFTKPNEEPEKSTTNKAAVSAEAPKSLFDTSNKVGEPTPATPFGKPTSTKAVSFTPQVEPTSSLFPSASGKPLFGALSKPEISATQTSATPANATATSFPSFTAPSLQPLASTSTSPFFSQPSKPEPAASTSTTEKDTAPVEPLFSFTTPTPSTPSFPTSTTTSNLFGGLNKPGEPATGAEIPAGFTPKPLFSSGFASSSIPKQANTESSKPTFAFGPTSTTFSAPDTPKAVEQPTTDSKSLFNLEPAKPTEKVLGVSEFSIKPTSFNQSTSNAASTDLLKTTSSVFQPPAPAADVRTLTKKPDYVDSNTQTQWDVDSELARMLPPKGIIPAGLDKAQKEDWIKRWRFKQINESFKQQIASIDASNNDFEPLIAYYYMLRQQIGYPCSLVSQYRAVPCGGEESSQSGDHISSQNEQSGQKRKADLEDDKNTPATKRGKSQVTQAPLKSPSKSSKRKVVDDEDEEETPPVQNGKRTKAIESSTIAKVNGVTQQDQAEPSETLRMFISSYVAAQDRESSPQPLQLGDDKEEEPSAVSTSEESASPDDASKDSPPSVASGASSAATNGSRSLFDRVELDKNGQPVRQIESDEKAEDKDAGTPADSNSNQITSLFSGTKFASSFNASGSVTPQFSFSSASATRTPSPTNAESDSKTPKASPPRPLFGSSTSAPNVPFGASSNTFMSKPASSSNGASTPNFSTLFGTTTSGSLFPPKPAESGTKGSNATLSPFSLSATTSVEPSPAATPAASDTGATETTEENENLPQVDLTRGGVGEEDEDVKFEIRARALKLKPGATWEVKGVGFLRILKHRDNGRSRMLLRADPSGNIILNASLIPQVDYAQRATSVQFLVPINGGVEQWALKVKEASKATELSSIMEELKKKD